MCTREKDTMKVRKHEMAASLPFRERKFYLLDVNIQKLWFPPPCVISGN